MPQADRRISLEGLTLYQYQSCPYCMLTRHAMQSQGIAVEMRDIRSDPHSRDELLQGGGRLTVPCLRIEEEGHTRWMYESRDIIRYLGERLD